MINNIFKTLARSLFILVLLVNASGVRPQTPSRDKHQASSGDQQRVKRFEKQVDDLRTLLKIPGMSAVIIKDQKVLWAKGFGFADFENRVPATPDTLYHIASLTKTFAATLVMQLVEQGKLDLDEPMSHYSSDFKDDSVEIKHLLTHTSKGPKPGEHYEYSGNRYEYLTAVIEKKTGKTFREVMVQTFLDPLAMSDSIPGHDVVDEADKWRVLVGKDNFSRYVKNLPRQAQPYSLYGDSEILHVPYPPKSFGASAGLLSTVLDMAKYDVAIDRHVFLKKETQEKAWTNFFSNSGQRLPHGLGWFVTDHQGIKLIWHYGHWGTGFSAIYLKVPEKNLSLIMLANSEALADHQFKVGKTGADNGETIVKNVFACNFLRLFVFEYAHGRRLPDPRWTESRPEFASELASLSNQSKGYQYDCERNSQAALASWREQRRAGAHVIIQVDPKILETYVGQYYFDPPIDQTLNISRDGSHLFIDIPSPKSELFAESESKFFLKTRPIQITFVRTGAQVTHLDFLRSGETTYRAKKIK